MLNSVPSSALYGNIGGLFLFSGGGAGGQRGGTAVAVAITAVAGPAFVAGIVYTRSGHLKSPWSRKRRKNALTPQQWRSAFDPDGKLLDGGIKLLKQIRSGSLEWKLFLIKLQESSQEFMDFQVVWCLKVILQCQLQGI